MKVNSIYEMSEKESKSKKKTRKKVERKTPAKKRMEETLRIMVNAATKINNGVQVLQVK